jgi:hypothetical protein
MRIEQREFFMVSSGFMATGAEMFCGLGDDGLFATLIGIKMPHEACAKLARSLREADNTAVSGLATA